MGEDSQPRRFMLSNGEKILLLLHDFYKYDQDFHVPNEMSQSGIAQVTGIKRCNVARELIRLKQKGLIRVKLVHFEGVKRRRNGYFLTDDGYSMANKTKNKINECKITVRKEDGSISEVMVSNVNKHLGTDMLLAEITSQISKKGMLDFKKERIEPVYAPSTEEGPPLKLVGRKEELKQLLDKFSDVSKGRGEFVLISGEAGIGKTRLVTEVKKKLAREDVHFLQGNCLYQSAIDPYLPFIEAFRAYIQREDSNKINSTMKDLVTTAPEFVGLMPLKSDGKEGTATLSEGDINLDRERTRIFETISRLLIRIAEEKPIVLFIDDLHWADVGSIHLLHYLARNIRQSPILLIGAYRPGEMVDVDGRPNPLKETLARLSRENLVEEIELKRLELVESKNMVKAYLRRKEAVPDELVSLIHKETDGNPFFIEEILSTLDCENLNQLPSKIEIPKSIKDTIMRRVEMLEDVDRNVLGVSSVIGERFNLDVLLKVINMDEGNVLDSIDELRRARLIEEDTSTDSESYRFHHCKIQEVIYEELNSSRRRRLHHRIGETLAELYREDIDKVVSELAFHYSNTKNFKKIYEYCWMAGKKASNVYSFDEAISNFNMALNAIENIGTNPSQVDEMYDNRVQKFTEHRRNDTALLSVTKTGDIEFNEKKGDLLDRLGDIYAILTKWDKAIELYTQVLGLTIVKNKKGEIIAKIGNIYRKKGMKFDDVVKDCEDALNFVDEECRERCSLLNCIGVILSAKGDFDRALENYFGSLKIAEKIGDQKILAQTYRNIGGIYRVKCEHGKALDYHIKSMEIFRNIGDEIGLSGLYIHLGILNYRICNYGEAFDLLDKSLAIREKIRDQIGIYEIYHNTGLIYFGMDEFDKALEFYEKGLNIIEKVDYLIGYCRLWTDIGLIYVKKGQYEKANEYLEKSLELSNKIGYRDALPYVYCLLAECSIEKNRDFEKSIELCNQALEISRNLGFSNVEGWSHEIFGLIYRYMEDWNSSMNSYKESIRIYKEIGHPVDLGETYYKYAMMLKEKGENEKVVENLGLALEIFKEKGLEKKIKRVEKALQEIRK